MALDSILSYLPKRIAGGVQYYADSGFEIEEIRFHRNEPILLVSGFENLQSGMICTDREFDEIFLAFCEQSVYAHTDTIRQGYISVNGGFRVGVGGDALVKNQSVSALKSIFCMNLRIAKDCVGIASPLYKVLQEGGFCESVLIYAPPGAGKTTLLRDLARQIGKPPHQKKVCVIDTRREFQTADFTKGTCIDLLSGYPKREGMEIAVRTLSAQYIVCDEIGNENDVEAIFQCMHAGVHLAAAAHAEDVKKLLMRRSFLQFHEMGVFDYYCGIQIKDKKRCLSIHRRQEFL